MSDTFVNMAAKDFCARCVTSTDCFRMIITDADTAIKEAKEDDARRYRGLHRTSQNCWTKLDVARRFIGRDAELMYTTKVYNVEEKTVALTKNKFALPLASETDGIFKNNKKMALELKIKLSNYRALTINTIPRKDKIQCQFQLLCHPHLDTIKLAYHHMRVVPYKKYMNAKPHYDATLHPNDNYDELPEIKRRFVIEYDGFGSDVGYVYDGYTCMTGVVGLPRKVIVGKYEWTKPKSSVLCCHDIGHSIFYIKRDPKIQTQIINTIKNAETKWRAAF